MTRFNQILEAVKEIKRWEDGYGDLYIEFSDGTYCIVSGPKKSKRWYDSNNKLHRDNGPAIVQNVIRRLTWYNHGITHRLDGPAVVDLNSRIVWYYVNGCMLSRKEYLKHFDDNTEYKDWVDAGYFTHFDSRRR